MIDTEETEAVEGFVRPLVNGGFAEWHEVVEAAVEYFVDDQELPEADVLAVVERLWRERLAEQVGWPPETEAERVLAALLSLSDTGIVARGNFTCCNTCGVAEIIGEARDGQRGYVFFHQQDTEAAAEGGGLYLSYGTFDGTDPVELGNEVVAALTAVGAPTVWDGSVSKRILVHPLEWRVRIS
jgi:hypothetical protein